MPLNNKPIISVIDLIVKYNGEEILAKLNFEILPQEVVAIIGPNGAGKTTLLKCLLGLLSYQGEIKIFGQNPKKVLTRIGYVPQKFSFDKNFPITVAEFLMLFSPKADFVKALSEVGMNDYAQKKIGELSGGQLQRVLIARALLDNPEILFLDEPTSGVDVEGAKDFYEIIEHQNKKHKTTILMISHEVNVVYNYATQVICLNRGLSCFGRPKETLTKKVLADLYGEKTGVRAHKH